MDNCLWVYTTKLQKNWNEKHCTGLIVYFFNMCELWMAELWWLVAFIRNRLLHFWNYFRIGEPPVLVPCPKTKESKNLWGRLFQKPYRTWCFSWNKWQWTSGFMTGSLIFSKYVENRGIVPGLGLSCSGELWLRILRTTLITMGTVAMNAKNHSDNHGNCSCF